MLNGETANEFDARVEKLWKTLDASNKGFLDVAGLKKGLDRMDHRVYFSVSLHKDKLELMMARTQRLNTPIISFRMF